MREGEANEHHENDRGQEREDRVLPGLERLRPSGSVRRLVEHARQGGQFGRAGLALGRLLGFLDLVLNRSVARSDHWLGLRIGERPQHESAGEGERDGPAHDALRAAGRQRAAHRVARALARASGGEVERLAESDRDRLEHDDREQDPESDGGAKERQTAGENSVSAQHEDGKRAEHDREVTPHGRATDASGDQETAERLEEEQVSQRPERPERERKPERGAPVHDSRECGEHGERQGDESDPDEKLETHRGRYLFAGRGRSTASPATTCDEIPLGGAADDQSCASFWMRRAMR